MVIERLLRFLGPKRPRLHGSVMLRGSLLDQAGGQRTDLVLSGDIEYWAYLATFGRWGFLPEVLLHVDGTRFPPAICIASSTTATAAARRSRAGSRGSSAACAPRTRRALRGSAAEWPLGTPSRMSLPAATLRQSIRRRLQDRPHRQVRPALAARASGWMAHLEAALPAGAYTHPLAIRRGATEIGEKLLSMGETNAEGRVQARDQGRVAAGGILGFLRSLNVSQWLLLLFPAFIWLVGRRRADEDVAVVDASAMMQIAMTGLCAIHLAFRWQHSQRDLSRVLFRIGPWLVWLAYCGFAISSAIWSEIPDLTLFRAAQATVFVVLAADALLTLRSNERRAKYLVSYAICVSLFVQYGNLLYGRYSLLDMHTSLAPARCSRRHRGMDCADRVWRRATAFVVLSVVLGTSVATYLSAILGIGLILVFDRSRYGRFAWVFMGVIALYMIAPETVTRLVTANRDERSIETASGRIPTWEIVLDQIVPKSPYVGFGFGYGEAMVRLGYAWGGARMTHMHSAVLRRSGESWHCRLDASRPLLGRNVSPNF